MKNIIIFLIILFLTACSSSGKKAVDNLYYRFPETTLTSTKPLVVKRPTAMGILGNRPMVVQTMDGALTQMHNNFWLDSPRVLLHNYLLKVFSTAPVEDTLTLDSRILKLEKKQQQALLEIKFIVTDNNRKQIFSKTYSQSKNLEDNTISKFSLAIGRMVEDLVNQLVNDL